MTRRSEPFFASFALSILLALVLLYGCRAFDPEPVIVNQPPETYIIGAPPETTGTRFLRHMYWYGTDDDGEVVRFIFAITDSTIQDHETPDVDEEDARFDPADDVTTLTPEDWRTIGYTALTDSVFLFEIDRGSTPSKDITFHLVAVDDRGAMDPTPARLRFFNNSLGNPVLKFQMYSFEDVGGGNMDWVHRWVGTPDGPSLGESPELSSRPVAGFSRRFRIDWEASSPNGEILGYRYKADQRNVPFTPPLDEEGDKQWDPSLRSFEYANDVPPDQIDECITDPVTGRLLETSDCPPEIIRWPSDNYVLRVQAIDEALVESEGTGGEMVFQVNYAPETDLIDDATWPLFRCPDGAGGTVEMAISPTDTVPTGCYAVFNATGYDKTEDLVAPERYGDLCCDVIIDSDQVEFQAEYEAAIDRGRFQTTISTSLSVPYQADSTVPGDVDTIGFNIGPFAYKVFVTARDEHQRIDESPESFSFVAGLQPRILATMPAPGDTLVFVNSGGGVQPFPGSLPFQTLAATRYWTGNDWVTDPNTCPPNTCQMQEFGTLFQFLAQFDGAGHPDEPNTTIRAWQFNYFPDNDPLNIISDGRESKDFSNWISKPSPGNQWIWNPQQGEAIEVFVPTQMFSVGALVIYEPSSSLPYYRSQGRWLARRLGAAQMTIRARTTAAGDTWPVYDRVRPDPNGVVVDYNIEDGGRRTNFLEIPWSLWLGIDTDIDNQADLLWPDFPYEDYAQSAP